MAGDDSENQGLFGAHTPRENSERAAKVGATRAAVEADMADLAAALAQPDEPEQQSLLLDEIDETVTIFGGPVKHVASQLDAHRRGRGRPKGSQNKASREFRDTLLRMGFKHPGMNLIAMANADPHALAIELAGFKVDSDREPIEQLDDLISKGKLTRGNVMELIARAHSLMKDANAELMPYFESKQAQPIDPETAKALGVMIIGAMPSGPAEQTKIIDLTKVDPV